MRKTFSFSGLRPASFPYISGDGFRKIADYIYDETQKFDPQLIEPGKIIFVKTDLINEYFRKIHSKIRYSYKLITHNSDYNITEKDLTFVDDKIIHWYAQNATVSHPKLTPLPIGLENKHYYFNGVTRLFNRLRKQNVKKKNRILFGFSVLTNPTERQATLNNLEKNPLADKISGFPLPPGYLRQLNSYQFVASPPGNGLDCHRTWEAMYLKTIPIVKRSPATEFWAKLGLPLLIIDNWSELAIFKEQELDSVYQEKITSTKFEPLFMDYWVKAIKQN